MITAISNSTFTENFITKINKFKQESQECDNSQTFQERFEKFKTSFEAAFYVNLKELDKSGMFEMYILQPLYQDVKNQMKILLENNGFREVNPENMSQSFDYYFTNDRQNTRTYFCVVKYIKKYQKLAD